MRFIYTIPELLLAIIGIVSGLMGVIPAILLIFPKKKGVKIFFIVMGVIIFLVYLWCSGFKRNLVEMPNVSGSTYPNAIQTLNEYGIKYIIIDKDKKDIINPNNWIVEYQSISYGDIINKNTTVLLTLYEIVEENLKDENSNKDVINNGIISNGDDTINIQDNHGTINLDIDNSKLSMSNDSENWAIDILNEIKNPITIGKDLIIDLAINTPPSQYSTPYILYAAYLGKSPRDWNEYYSLRIPAEQSHIKLTIDTYLLGLPADDYIFAFGLFRSDDYSSGNEYAKILTRIQFLDENKIFESDVSDNNVVKHEFLDYYTVQKTKYSEDTEKLSLINVNDMDIKIISHLSNLTELDIIGSDITNIEPLRNLKNLKSLSVHSNNLSDISAIEDIPNLTYLSIGGENYNGIGTHGILEDISPIENLSDLTILIIYDCNVKDISCIENLKMLEYISIFKTKVDDISALTDLRFINELKLHANNIKDITPLNDISNLTRLVISNNNLSEEQINEFKESHPDCRVYSKD